MRNMVTADVDAPTDSRSRSGRCTATTPMKTLGYVLLSKTARAAVMLPLSPTPLLPPLHATSTVALRLLDRYVLYSSILAFSVDASAASKHARADRMTSELTKPVWRDG